MLLDALHYVQIAGHKQETDMLSTIFSFQRAFYYFNNINNVNNT